MYCALGGANKTNLLNIKHFFNTSSYFASRFTKSSRTIVNISLIASLALSQSLAAVTLPSGGKFVNGTGSITKPNDNTMNIAGDKTHNVIAWGGGFNIGKGYTVDFTTENLNYLNLDYTNKASQILGTLKGGTNSVYIVNPSGVLIGEGATINANKFGVSTTPFDDNAKETFLSKGSFSPVLSPNTKGDVVNMGTINANEIVLVGNKVENLSGKLQGKAPNSSAEKVTIEGNKVYLEGSRIKATNLDAKIESEGFYRYEAKELEDAVKSDDGLLEGYKFTTKGDFKKYLYIGKESATNDEMIDSWTGFTKLFNDKKLQGWGFNDIYLGNNIDFKNKLIDSVGEFATLFDPSNKPFSGNFYGNGYTLSNLLINAEGKKSAGLFAYINGGSVQDLTINGLNFQGSASYMGGLAGYINNVDMSTGIIKNGTFSNIALRNIGDISSSDNHAGGFAGYIGYATLSNIALENIGNISSNGYAGGFAGQIESSTLSNIALKNIGNISGSNAGGFAGWIGGINAKFSNIALSGIGNISGDGSTSNEIRVGGFAGNIGNAEISNVVLKDIGDISSSSSSGGGGGSYAGGFAGEIDNATLSNITLNNIGTISSSEFAGGFAGKINSGTYSNIAINTINKKGEGDPAINASNNGDDTPAANAGGFAGSIEYAEISNVVLSDIQGIMANSGSNNSYAGGFAGSITDGIFSNIALNNIDSAQAHGKVGYISAGGFAGYIKKGGFSNIVLNDIRSIIAKANTAYAYAGGFAGKIGEMSLEGGRFSNIVLNNMPYIYSERSSSTIDHVPYAGGFAGYIEKGDFSNIVLNSMYIKAYNKGPTKYAGVFLGTGSTYTAEKIYSYGVVGSSLDQTGIDHPNSTALDLTQLNDLQKLQNNSGISGLKYHEMQDEDGILYPYLHMVTNGNVGGEDSEITFDEENFTYNASNIPEINPDGSGTSSLPEVSNEEELSDVVVGWRDFNEGILNSILGGTSLEFDLLSGDLESIRQSLDFLTAFLKYENTVSDDFDYIPNDNYDSDVHVKFKDNLQVFIENAIQDKDLDLDFLKGYRASLEKYNNDKKLYESGLLHPELQASLEKDLEKQYAELLGSKDKVDLMLGIFGDYKLILDKDKTIFTDNEKSNLKFKVGIGELVNYKNTEGGGENNNNFNPPSDLSKQTELSSKEPILVLPAEETQNVIDEGERELGRVCIVSDNAKTSNPCIAIAF